MSKLIAATFPGKLGDLLYGFHVARRAAEIHNAKVDFYTSATYHPIVEKMMRYQSFINNVLVAENYILNNEGMGWQPVDMNILPNIDYAAVYQLGYRSGPNIPLHMFIAQSNGISGDIPIKYEFPDVLPNDLPEKYYTICTRGVTTYNHIYDYMMQHSEIPIVQIGAVHEWQEGNAINKCGLDILDTLPILAHSSGFVSIPSGELVLANGFPDLLKIGMHDGIHWDTRVFVQSPTNLYPILPSGQDVLNMLRS